MFCCHYFYSEVANGDYTKRETYAYASYLLQMLKGMTLSEEQCSK